MANRKKIECQEYRRRVRQIDQEMKREGKEYTPAYLAARLGVDPKTNKRYLVDCGVGWPPFRHEARLVFCLRVCLEAGLAATTMALFGLTLVCDYWIELVFHVDPDARDGFFEKLIPFVLGMILLGCVWRLRIDWRRWRRSAGDAPVKA